ncbi:MAG: hypothetical protein AB7O28_23925 [Vicinamibacterales bacterium]
MTKLTRNTIVATALAGTALAGATALAWRTELAAPGAPAAEDHAARRDVTIPVGTTLRLRLDTSHASNTSRVEDLVRAHLAAPLVVDGRTVVPIDSEVTGHVVSVRPSGKVKGRGYLAVRFSEIRSERDDRRYDVTTRTWAREAPGTKKKDAATIAAPAGVGAVVGAIVDGKKGAAIGAGVGAGAGTGVVLATSGKEVRLPRGSTLLVRLAAPLTIRVS